MENRRLGDRRGEERREFRIQEGRRDPERDPRNRLSRWALALFLPVMLLLLALGAYRYWVVQPDRNAESVLDSIESRTAPVLARTTLPMLAFPGTAGPVAGDPSVTDLPLAVGDRTQLEQAETTLDALWSDVPRSSRVAAELGRLRLVLGRDRDARRAWESVLVYGSGEQRATARIGLALIALRVGLRQLNEQDRLFALEHALDHLGRLDEFSGPALAFDRGVILAALGRLDEARAALKDLSSRTSDEATRKLLEDWIEQPFISGAVDASVATSSFDSLPPSSSLPTIDVAVDPSTETESIGSPE